MKKLWSYIAIFFVGLSSGIVVAVKYLSDKTVFKGDIRIKQRGKGNRLNSKLDANLPIKDAPGGRLGQWKNRRIEKKKLRSLKRLEKLS